MGADLLRILTSINQLVSILVHSVAVMQLQISKALNKSADVAFLKYLINTIGLNSKLPPEALGGVELGTVFGQLALVVVTHCRLNNTQSGGGGLNTGNTEAVGCANG